MQSQQKKRYGLITRLASHASGRLSGDQFCGYVANRLVVPSLQMDQISAFASGKHTLERLTKSYIHCRFEYQFVISDTSKQAYALEMEARRGETFCDGQLISDTSIGFGAAIFHS